MVYKNLVNFKILRENILQIPKLKQNLRRGSIMGDLMKKTEFVFLMYLSTLSHMCR